MNYKFCTIRINVTKYDVTFATKGGGFNPLPVATPLILLKSKASDNLINFH